MNVSRLFLPFLLVLSSLQILPAYSQRKKQIPTKTISISTTSLSNNRINFGLQKLSEGLKNAGYTVHNIPNSQITKTTKNVIIIGKKSDVTLQKAGRLFGITSFSKVGKEGFTIVSGDYDNLIIAGSDNSGTLYGCLELADRIRKGGKLPQRILFTDRPEMVLRGTCIGLQKSTLLPGRGVYEYPYTPKNFPWFYNKKLWINFLDSMVENRMNSLYLWNGHPFASLVKLKKYPYALEVDDSTFKKNEEMYKFLTTEADKRGIWVIQMFYNIIVSKPFAEKNHIKTQDRNRHITPLIADYTRRSIAAFVEKYPNVGLLVTLGEAMEGVGQDDIDWFTKTIIPGVKDGLKALGKKEEPPIVLRAHDTDAPSVMKEALPLYKNLYTMAKYNGEALTTYEPRGTWAQLHRTLSSIGTVQIENVHLMANLEPFRYAADDFIQKCVLAMHDIYHSNGLHVYPQASYWDWPYTADKITPRLLQIDRDWMWYKAWARYSWNCHRKRSDEISYWSNQLAFRYGSNVTGGKDILEAFEQSGEIAPKLLRRFGITDGNRQTLTLGMLMTQLINPYRYGLFTLLYNSEAPEGEMLTEYAEKEWKHEKHIGETPVQIIKEVKVHGQKAVEAIEHASSSVTKDKEDFERIKNDMYCYNALANNYGEKAQAALYVLRYKYSNDITDLEKAIPHLKKSLDWYKTLVRLTKDSYWYANSMQTKQRKIPVSGKDGNYKTWTEMLPVYEKELTAFKKNVDSLKAPKTQTAFKKIEPLQNAQVTLITKPAGYYSINTGKELFTDTSTYIKNFAEELRQLKGLKYSRVEQLKEGTHLEFSNVKPVKVLVGYFNTQEPEYLQPPTLENDASANDYGQAQTKIENALIISGMPPVNIHTFSFKEGNNKLDLPKGAVLILGFVDDDKLTGSYDTGLSQSGVKEELDWLFK